MEVLKQVVSNYRGRAGERPSGTREGGQHAPVIAPNAWRADARRHRMAVGAMFFIHGLCFSSWASRIPSIQQQLQLSSAQLGSLLLMLPLGFFLSLPAAGWLVSKAGSKRVAIFSGVGYSVALSGIGFSNSMTAVVIALFGFGFFGNLLNISINTQAVNVEALTKKTLMASFHGMWSIAGFAGAAIGSGMIGLGAAPLVHFVLIAGVFLVATAVSAPSLVPNDGSPQAPRPLFSLPDKSILSLGIIAFCSMMVEGAMFDWSGIYFLNEVHVAAEFTGIGYTTFMIAMAAMRFMADRLTTRFGLRRMLQASGMVATAGLALAIAFPYPAPSLLGFFMIGMGVSAVVPLVYSEVGKSKTLSPGVALSAVSSLGFMGLLVGPPAIGFIAEATSLRISFLMLAIMALAVVALATFLHKRAA